MTNSEKIRVGIIGLGDGGMCNLRALQLIPDFQIVALCDRDEQRLLAAHGELERTSVSGGIASCPDEASFFRDDRIDLIIVATPDNAHLAPTRAALEAGKQVFVEKPLFTDMEELTAWTRLIDYGGPHRDRIFFGEKYSWANPVQAAWNNEALGDFLTGSTLYTMWRTRRIMGDGKWRTEQAYNPCAGGLSHNFMTALLFGDGIIARVMARGSVRTYQQNLDRYGGFDTMEGVLEFYSGSRMTWSVCLAVEGDDTPYQHRTITHYFQFRNGSLCYGPSPEHDQLIVGGRRVPFEPEPSVEQWPQYNIGTLYRKMHENTRDAIRGDAQPLHTVDQGFNVAAACAAAFQSAKQGGTWIEVSF